MSKSQPDSLFPDPIEWYRFVGGTHWNIQSKVPLGFTIYCVTGDGAHANPTGRDFHGHESPVGTHYQAINYNTSPASISPIYAGLQEAKEACDFFLMHGSFPPADLSNESNQQG